ncbi:putative oxidoreductase [Candidatus Thermokryptus mobilis]|uniref:Putative oxidoreductase n=1 Tax=Candidatus Thermokryptus mobilis TaxID=1643428 RepID=A0A0S4N4P2_9BACT|nr:DoxX family protein [Candidatus Thermokryptus mobilis]CUU05688.1 putative oxidoreductase [Candidatus Thermokryptus mobilis]
MARISSIALSLLRFATGLMLALFHGLGKVNGALGFFFGDKEWRFIQTVANLGFPAPVVFASLSALAEFVGGLLLAVGLFTRYVSAFIAINMAVAVYSNLVNNTKYELALLYFLISLVYLFKSGEGISLDNFIRRGKI